ncbi:unnamed protein product, partial [Scytosiphon promiscuus]
SGDRTRLLLEISEIERVPHEGHTRAPSSSTRSSTHAQFALSGLRHNEIIPPPPALAIASGQHRQPRHAHPPRQREPPRTGITRTTARMFLLSLRMLILSSTAAHAWVSPPWVSPQAHHPVASSLSLPQHKPITRWDADLARAREAHREKNWGDVHRLCSKVIDMADDWNAVEQAHLRLALAEQKRCGIDGGRRAFQHGAEDCPSSDTLLLAWALMESKIHNARARKTAWALLRRAVALNPKKHSKVLKWTMFTRDLDWVEAAGGAAVQAVRSALSPAASTRVGNETVERRGKASASRAEARREAEVATELQALCHTNEALLREQEDQGTTEAGGNAVESHGRTLPFASSSSPAGGMPVPAASPTNTASSLAPSARFRELAGELEKVGAGAEAGVRALSGTWRLVFTTCKECDRVLVRTGAEVYQRLTPPIMAIKPTPSCKNPAPFRCEVLLRPPHGTTTTTTGKAANASKAGVAYFMRGWASRSPPTKEGKGSLLRQHVAARSATVVRAARVPSPTPPAAVFSALGVVSPSGGKGLEKLASQEVTYVGKQLRIGRTRGGDV